MSNAKKEAYLAAIRCDLKVFLQQAFATLYPGKAFLDNWHLNAILHGLEQAIEGKQPRLIINLPPRQLKSFIASVALPAFLLGQDPSVKMICVSYSDELAKTLSRDFLRIVESEWYQRVFPNVRSAKMTENEFATADGGSRYATSVGGTLTGRGGDFIIIDDPIKPVDALSQKSRESLNEWYRSTLLSRLDDKRKSVLILVMQRLHINDLIGFAEAGGGFHKLSLPAIALQNEEIAIGDNGVHTRSEGEALHPEREDIDVLDGIRNQLGAANFAAQYQQQPELPNGAMFRRKWFHLIGKPPTWQSGGRLYVSVDTALSTAETADYSAISVVYADRSGYYVMKAERGHWDYEELQKTLLGYYARHKDRITFIIEPAGVGISLVSYMRKTRIPCPTSSLKDSKLQRAGYAVPAFEEGRIHILDVEGENAWVEPYLAEFLSFPHGRFDDQVDSLAQLINYLDRRFTVKESFWSA